MHATERRNSSRRRHMINHAISASAAGSEGTLRTACWTQLGSADHRRARTARGQRMTNSMQQALHRHLYSSSPQAARACYCAVLYVRGIVPTLCNGMCMRHCFPLQRVLCRCVRSLACSPCQRTLVARHSSSRRTHETHNSRQLDSRVVAPSATPCVLAPVTVCLW